LETSDNKANQIDDLGETPNNLNAEETLPDDQKFDIEESSPQRWSYKRAKTVSMDAVIEDTLLFNI
jgi:hypothetical protein